MDNRDSFALARPSLGRTRLELPVPHKNISGMTVHPGNEQTTNQIAIGLGNFLIAAVSHFNVVEHRLDDNFVSSATHISPFPRNILSQTGIPANDVYVLFPRTGSPFRVPNIKNPEALVGQQRIDPPDVRVVPALNRVACYYFWRGIYPINDTGQRQNILSLPHLSTADAVSSSPILQYDNSSTYLFTQPDPFTMGPSAVQTFPVGFDTIKPTTHSVNLLSMTFRNTLADIPQAYAVTGTGETLASIRCIVHYSGGTVTVPVFTLDRESGSIVFNTVADTTFPLPGGGAGDNFVFMIRDGFYVQDRPGFQFTFSPAAARERVTSLDLVLTRNTGFTPFLNTGAVNERQIQGAQLPHHRELTFGLVMTQYRTFWLRVEDSDSAAPLLEFNGNLPTDYILDINPSISIGWARSTTASLYGGFSINPGSVDQGPLFPPIMAAWKRRDLLTLSRIASSIPQSIVPSSFWNSTLPLIRKTQSMEMDLWVDMGWFIRANNLLEFEVMGYFWVYRDPFAFPFTAEDPAGRITHVQSRISVPFVAAETNFDPRQPLDIRYLGDNPHLRWGTGARHPMATFRPGRYLPQFAAEGASDGIPVGINTAETPGMLRLTPMGNSWEHFSVGLEVPGQVRPDIVANPEMTLVASRVHLRVEFSQNMQSVYFGAAQGT